MKQEQTYKCSTLNDVYEKTKLLDKARLVDKRLNDGGVWKDIKNFRGVYNVGKGQYCGEVTTYYNLIQHKKYFDSFATALNRLGINFTATINQIGHRAIMDINFVGRNIKFEKLNEEFTTGLRLINSYNKQSGLYVSPRFTRLACTNGMIVNRFSDTISIKHTQELARDINKFVEVKISELINRNDELKTWVSGCMDDSIEWLMACKIIHKLFKQPKHLTGILDKIGIGVIEIEDKKTKKTLYNYVWNKKEDKKSKLTRWELYNAITSYLTHSEHITPHIENYLQGTAEKVLVTPLKKMKVMVPAI